jgi:hypothetical protein
VTEGELQVARARLRSSAPNVSDEQFAAWVEHARSKGATFALTLDGCVASYPSADAPAAKVCAATGGAP